MKGRLSIGKVTCCGNREKDYIRIQLEDSLSSMEFVQVKVDLKTFTQALFGLSNVPMEFELMGIDRVGKKYEHKTVEVLIPRPDIGSPSDDVIHAAIKPYEIDGWIGRSEDAKNHHNRVENIPAGSVYKIHFCRWVEVEGEGSNEKES